MVAKTPAFTRRTEWTSTGALTDEDDIDLGEEPIDLEDNEDD